MSLIQVYRVYQYCNNSLKEIPCNPLDINEIERLLITYGKIKLTLSQKVIRYLMIDLDWTYRSLLVYYICSIGRYYIKAHISSVGFMFMSQTKFP